MSLRARWWPANASRGPRCVTWCAALVLLAAPCAAAEQARTPRPPLVTLTRDDAWFALGAAAAAGGMAFADLDLRRHARTWNGAGARHVADVARKVPEAAVAVALLGYAGGRLFDRPGLAGASRRVAISIGAAAVATEAIKLPVGRVRPDEFDTVAIRYDPFSRHDSFPSGHASIAFAAAVAIDRETRARWVPWVAYPAAAVVGWSRVHDDRHWGSDVVAGAALGGWVAWKAEDHLRARDGRLGVRLDAAGRGARLAARLAF